MLMLGVLCLFLFLFYTIMQLIVHFGIKKIRHFVIRDKYINQGTLCTLMCSQLLWFIFVKIF